MAIFVCVFGVSFCVVEKLLHSTFPVRPDSPAGSVPIIPVESVRWVAPSIQGQARVHFRKKIERDICSLF